jgi:hypothetical protein
MKGARSFPLVLLSTLGLVLACGQTYLDGVLLPGDAGAGASGASGDATAPCAQLGDTCATSSACCSNLCQAGVCAQGGGCLQPGEDCGVGGSVCCSNACVELLPGAFFCQSIGGCKPTGELCSTSEQCCTKSCVADGSGVKKCGQPANCRPPGEICDPSFGECCPGAPQGKLLCFEGSYGVMRCQGPCCAFGGSACTADAECCSKKCNPNTAACEQGFVCKVVAEACASGAECCSNVCTGGKCADCMCKSDGQPCQVPDDCCGGRCSPDPSDGNELKCGTSGGPLCNAEGAPCASNGDCCSGLCGGGELPACKASSCKSVGAACTSGAACCAGLTCKDGICTL